jgi:hypothetical protein
MFAAVQTIAGKIYRVNENSNKGPVNNRRPFLLETAKYKRQGGQLPSAARCYMDRPPAGCLCVLPIGNYRFTVAVLLADD